MQLTFEKANRPPFADDLSSSYDPAYLCWRDERHLYLQCYGKFAGPESCGYGGRHSFIQHGGQHAAVDKSRWIKKFGLRLHFDPENRAGFIEVEQSPLKQVHDRRSRKSPIQYSREKALIMHVKPPCGCPNISSSGGAAFRHARSCPTANSRAVPVKSHLNMHYNLRKNSALRGVSSRDPVAGSPREFCGPVQIRCSTIASRTATPACQTG